MVSASYTRKDIGVEWTENPLNIGVRAYRVDYHCTTGIISHFIPQSQYHSIVSDNRVYQDTLSYEENASAGVTRAPEIRVYIQGSDGVWGDSYLEIDASNPAPTITVTPEISSTLDGYQLRITPPSDTDIAGYVVHMSSTSGFTPGSDNLVYDGPDTRIPLILADDSNHYIRVACYDVFGKSGLSYTTQQTVNRVSFEATVAATDAITDLYTVYGDTASAAASATAAQDAQTLAETARDDAQAAFDAADGAAELASNAASAASGSASTATTQAGIAVSARDTAISVSQNPFFDQGTLGWETFNVWTAVSSSGGRANILRSNIGSSSQLIGPSVAIAEGTPRYRLSIGHRLAASAGDIRFYAGLFFYDSAGTIIGGTDGTGNYPLGAFYPLTIGDGWVDRQVVVGPGAPYGPYGGTADFPSGAKTFRLVLYFNYTGSTDAVCEIDYFRVQDVTSEIASAGSAEAASTSASLANVKKEDAEAAAEAAAASAVTANTKAGESATSAEASSTAKDGAVAAYEAAHSSAEAASASAVTANSTYVNTVLVGGNQYFDEGSTGWSITSGATVATSLGGRTNVFTHPTSGAAANVYSDKKFSFDTSRKYKIKIAYWTGSGGAGSQVYAGFGSYDASGTGIAHNPGSYAYVTALGVTQAAGAGWVEYISDVIEPQVFGVSYGYPPGTVSIGLVALCNYNYGTTPWGVDYITLLDVTEAEDAAASASAASLSESVASTKSSEAEAYASAAHTDADTASTERGLAEAARGQAVTAKESAQGYAESAASYSSLSATSAGAALRDAAQLLPSTFAEDGRFFTHLFYQSMENRLATPLSTGGNVAFANITTPSPGRVLVATGELNFSSVGRIALEEGQTYEGSINFIKRVGGTGSYTYCGVVAFDAAETYLGASYFVISSYTSANDSEQIKTGRITTAEIRAGAPTAAYIVPFGIVNYPNASGSTHVTQVKSMGIRNVTALAAAEAEASAASISASVANTKKDEAGVYADAANTSALAANTSAGEANLAKIDAVSAKETAEGYSSSASTSYSLSATARDAARQAAQSTIPDNFTDPYNWADFNNWSGGTTTFSGGLAHTTTGGAFTGIFQKPISSDATYRVTMRFRTVNQGGGNTYIGIRIFNTAGTYIGYMWTTYAGVASPTLNQWTTASGTITAATILASYPTAGFITPLILVGYDVVSDAEVSQVLLEDVSSETAAYVSAGAAAASVVTASGHVSSAQTYSNLAATSYTDTVTFTGNPNFDAGLTGWGHTSGSVVTSYASATNVFYSGLSTSVTIYSLKLYPIDTTRRYRLRTKFRAGTNAVGVSGYGAQFYIGLIGYDAAGNQVDHGAYGSYRYAAELGGRYLDSNGWQVRDVLISGEGNDSWTKFPTGTKQVSLMAFVNYEATSGQSGYIDYLTIEDTEAAEASAGSASAANASAVSAGSAAASAASSAVLSASIGLGLRNKNPTFADWTYPTGVPPNWSQSYGSASMATRIAGDVGGYAYDVTVGAGESHELQQSEGTGSFSPGYYVLELDIEHVSGNWNGGGVRLYSYNSSGTFLEAGGLNLPTDSDVNGNVLGSTPAAKRYYFRKIVALTNSATSQYYFGVSGGGLFAAQSGTGRNIIRRAGFRPATSAEVRDQTVLAPLVATVASNASAQSTVNSAQATTNSILSASASGTASSAIKDATFNNWTSSTSPTDWIVAGIDATRTTGESKPYALTQAVGSGVNGYVYQTLSTGSVSQNQWWVLSASVRLDSGTLVAGGIMLRTRDSGYNYLEDRYLTFSTDKDSTNTVVGDGVVGKTYRFSKLVQLTASGTQNGEVYAMTHHGNQGSIASANQLTWFLADARPATDQEIASNTATSGLVSLNATVSGHTTAISSLDSGKANASDLTTLTSEVTTARGGAGSLNARLNTVESDVSGKASASSVSTLSSTVDGHTSSISTNASAVANINSRLSASYGVTVGTGDRFASFKLLTESGGGTEVSSFDIAADKFRVYNGSSSVPAFEVSSGAAYVGGSMVRTASIETGAVQRITSSQGTNTVHPVSQNSNGNILVKSLSFTVDNSSSKITILFSADWRAANANLVYMYMIISSIATPTWSSNRMTNAHKEGWIGKVDNLNCVATMILDWSAGLSAGSHTVDVYCNSSGSGTHADNDIVWPFLQVIEAKRPS